nr:alpha-L-rhamnosidase [Streptomyces sp. S3(2020)]
MLRDQDWNGATWISERDWAAGHGVPVTDKTEPVVVTFPPTTARILSLEVTRLGLPAVGETGRRLQLAEVEARDGADGTNVAAGAHVTAADTLLKSGWNPSYLVDGTTDSANSSRRGYSSTLHPSADVSAEPIVLDLDLGAERSVDRVVLYPRTDVGAVDGRSAGFPTEFRVTTKQYVETRPQTTVATYAHETAPARGGSTLLGLPLLRTNFSATKQIANATLYISGLGAYAPSLNGAPVGTIVLGSGWTKYDKVTYYDGIDVTSAVRQGENTIGIALGQGTLNGIHAWATPDNRGAWDGVLRTKALLQVTYADGTTKSVPTNTSWTAALGPSMPFANGTVLPEVEGYDARLEQPGWNTPSFNDSRWASAVTVGNGTARLQASPIEPSRVVGEINLGRPATPAPGVFVYDVGQNISGNARITLDVTAGTAVRIRYAESLGSNGRAVVAGNRLQDDTFIGNGSGPATWTPSFTHKGFQYIEVSGLPNGATAPPVTALRIHNDVRSVGTFDSSDEVLNFVHNAGRETVLNNFVLAAPTDGSYLEKLPWLGDGALMADATMRNFDTKALYTKWYNDIADSQRDDGDLPAWAPAPTKAADLSSAAWGNAFTEVAALLLRNYDAEQAVAARYGQLRAYAEHEWSEADNPVELWGDWVCPDGDSVCNTADDKKLVARAYAYRTLDQFAGIAKQLGHTDDAVTFSGYAASARTAFNNDYFSTATSTYRTTSEARFLQTNNVLPVAFGITPAVNRRAVVDAVAADVVARGNHLGTGVLGTKWLFRVLTRYGHLDTAYEAATQRTAPGYGEWMVNGATTLWEQWTASPRSKGHPFLGTAEDWLLADIAGLAQTGGATTEVVVKPHMPTSLQRASTSFQTNGGTVSVSWKRKNGELTLTVEVPVNRTGTIYVPMTGSQKVIAPSRAIPGRSAGGYKLYTVPSGHYIFRTAKA